MSTTTTTPTFSYDPAAYHAESGSSLSQNSKTPPPLESALSSSDQYSPETAVHSAGSSSPHYLTDPLSLIPNPFEVAAGDSASARSSTSVDPSLHMPWHPSDMEPTPVVSSSTTVAIHDGNANNHMFPPHVHRPHALAPAPASTTTATNNAAAQAKRTSRPQQTSLQLGTEPDEDANDNNASGKDRRQKRLERNRESARLSRRRRKHYLEVLETKVTELSDEMDRGRRQHVSQALATVATLRQHPRMGQAAVARTSAELRLAADFRAQQIESLCAPPSTKFIHWLTLQNDAYFRGGRAASERLSAARIGERMLQNGNDKVTPAQSMWPLFCNEIALSYDQEERVRNFQKTLLADKDSWLDRHTAFASSLTLKSTHQAVQAVAFGLGHRERATDGLLSPTQRAKLGEFVRQQRSVLQQRLTKKDDPKAVQQEFYQTRQDQHVAANLYIINHRFRTLLNSVPRAPPLLTGAALKKLSRRPSFESLGLVAGDKKDHDDHHHHQEQLSRDRSFASSGSLKRSASEMSIDGEDRSTVHIITPEEAEAMARPHVDSILGRLHPIMPVPTPAAPAVVQHMPRGVPRSFASAPALAIPSMTFSHPPPAPVVPAPPAVSSNVAMPAATDSTTIQEPSTKHQRRSSFLPPHLNVVPEEMWTNDAVAEEFLMSLTDEDWAIGAHFD